MSKISIALCTYNGEKYLRAQLESLAVQTRLPDELIINDDVSTDATAKIIVEFAKAAPFPVSLEINEKTLGSTKNFERAIWRSSGDIIFLCDQDDVWAAEKIERLEKVFRGGERIGMVFSNAALVDENLRPLGKSLWDFSFPESQRKKEKMFESLLRQNFVTGATAAFRAEFREYFTPIPTDIPNTIHDAWIALVIAARARVEFIDANLLKYRQHSAQQLGIMNRSETRRETFEYSVAFARKEILRLEKMRAVLNEFPAFQIAEIQNAADEIINRNLEERRESIEHYEARMNLPQNRFGRIIPVWRELQTGRYRRFSKGWASAAKDLAESF
jgi:glycosyltransferase involved in cell wall biosynthesis